MPPWGKLSTMGALLINRDEHFYQLGLQQFGGIGRLKLDPPPTVAELVTVAAEAESGIAEAGLDVDAVVEVSLRRLCH